ncbi:alpha/beta fold hydrolase [Arthrobacter sp. PAMC 25486]|uniref:alpha/beta hydrolase family protein n=1 Tax=Arthrobacter sp. PAMC 25486 TaxID=1494608 RepID=UPI000571E0C9|nr:alpha/beta fold hydrolase [Arthrobacter sp. PAMC 25486]
MELTPRVELAFTCPDGRELQGTLFQVPDGVERLGTVVIGCATAVKANYYQRYAAFLATAGFTAITFDYRGIGESRGGSLRGQTIRWYEWGSLDIDTVLAWAFAHDGGLPVNFVGHSFGGFGVGLAERADSLGRILTVGAQHAYWRDLTLRHQAGHWGRAALMLPLIPIFGYFPAKRLGLMEDLPAGVALDWARSRKDFTTAARGPQRTALLAHQASVTAPILALAPDDDSYATLPAMERAVASTPNSPSRVIHLHPEDYGETSLGHFALFHSRYKDTFWEQSLAWLKGGDWV